MGTKASPTDEWIELYNPNALSISLEGWTITSESDGTPSALLTGKPLSGSIPPGGYYILERSDDATLSISAQWAEPFGGAGLNNQGERLVLLNAQGDVQDTVGGQGAWYAGDSVTKASMERIDPLAPGNVPNNWRTAAQGSSVKDQAGNAVIGSPGFSR